MKDRVVAPDALRRKAPWNKPVGWAFVTAALLAVATLMLLYRNYRTEAEAHRQVLIERGQTVLNALAAGIRAHGRMGRYESERLTAIFEEVASTPGVFALALWARDGTLVASAGDASVLSSGPTAPSGATRRDAPPNSPQWEAGLLLMATEEEIAGAGAGHRQSGGRGPGRGLGRQSGRGAQALEEWTPFPEGPFRLAVALDAAPLARLIRRDRIRFVLSAIVCLGAVVFGTGIVAARLRQRDLRAALALAQERGAIQERLAQLGAGLAHETKNPLGIVRGLAQTISSGAQPEAEVRRLANTIVDEADRTVGRINSFLALARPKEPDLAAVDVDALLAHLSALVQPELAAERLTLDCAGAGVIVLADEDLLQRAMLNLMVNAIRASRAGGKILVEAETQGGAVALRVSDEGCGIAPEDLPHVTEPYFTRFDGGCGLGLAVVDQIARAHQWVLDIRSVPDRGAQVSLRGIRRVR